MCVEQPILGLFKLKTARPEPFKRLPASLSAPHFSAIAGQMPLSYPELSFQFG